MQVMLPAAMRAKYEKFIIVNEPEKIEDDEFSMFLAGRKRVPMKEAETRNLLGVLKRLVKEGVVTVDTTVSQQTAMKKVRMIRIEEETELRAN